MYPDIKWEVTDRGDCKEVKLVSDVFARAVYLSVKDSDILHFSENFFDLYPGEEYVVTVKTDITAEDLSERLQTNTINYFLYEVSLEDYVSGRVFDDALVYSFYPIDLHNDSGVLPQQLEKDRVATVPLRALIPEGSRHMTAAGRCISSDQLANSALRVQATCMATGQAAGAAAALAVIHKTTPAEVSLDELRDTLASHGSIRVTLP